MLNSCRIAIGLAVSVAMASPALALDWFDNFNTHANTYQAKRHDLLYSGQDRQFIGDGYDWSGIGEAGMGNQAATMVSPSFFITAGHYHPGVGATITFYGNTLPGAPTYTDTVAQYWNLGNDCWLGRMASPVNPAITYYSVPVFYDDISEMPLYGSLYSGREVFYVGHNDTKGLQFGLTTLSGISNSTYTAYFGDANFVYPEHGGDYCRAVSGDSSHPSFIIGADGRPSVVGTHMGVTSDNTPIPYISSINAIMAPFGEQLTLMTDPNAPPPLLPPAGIGATITWTGGASDANWYTGGNWSGGIVPGATDNVRIAAGLTSGSTIKLGLPYRTSINSLTVLSDANGWDVSGPNGQTITLVSGNLTRLDGSAAEPNVTLNVDINQGATGEWRNDSSSGNLIIQGIIGGPGGINKTGVGTISIASSTYAHSYQGATTVREGILSFSPQDATGYTSNVIPDFSAVTIFAGAMLQVGKAETFGSLAGDGNLAMATAGNQQLAIGADNTSTTFGGTIYNMNGGTGYFRKIGAGTFTVTGDILAGAGATAYAVDGKIRLVDQGKMSTSLTAMPGAVFEIDDTGAQRQDRIAGVTISVGGEFIVRGHADANTIISGTTNSPIKFNIPGAPMLTLIPGAGYEAWLNQNNGSNSGMFAIGSGDVALFRGDNLGGTTGTRSRFTIKSTDLKNFLVGGAGAVFPDANYGAGGTPRTSILLRAYGDSSSSGWGTGFVTYSLGSDKAQNANDPGIRPLTDSEYSSTILSGEAADDKTQMQNKRISAAIGGIDANTRINSLLMQDSASLSGSGVLNVHSGMFMSTGAAAAINVASIFVPREGTNPAQISLITPLPANRLTIASDISTAADGNGLVKVGQGTAVLTGVNAYVGRTYIAGGALRANDGVSLPSASGLIFSGGVLEANGTFSRLLGSGNGKVQWYNANGSGADGGFAAGDGDLTVNINNNSGMLTWGDGNFVALDRTLVLGSVSSQGRLTFANPINLSAATPYSSVREIRVIDNPNFDGDVADLAGGVTGPDKTVTLRKTGNGTLTISGINNYCGYTVVEEGTLELLSTMPGGPSGITVNSGAALVLGHWFYGAIPSGSTYGGTNRDIRVNPGGILSTGGGMDEDGEESPVAWAGNWFGDIDLSGIYHWKLGALKDDAAGEDSWYLDYFDSIQMLSPYGLGSGDSDTGYFTGVDPVLDLSFLNGTAPTGSGFWLSPHEWTVVGGAAGIDIQGGWSITGYGDNGYGSDGHFDVRVTSDSVLLDWTPVPEPATMTLLALGAMSLLRRRPAGRKGMTCLSASDRDKDFMPRT